MNNWLQKILGDPDVVIGDDYLERWYLIPRNRWLNIYLHRFTGSDDDRALHDHPWHSVSLLLAGRCHEIVGKTWSYPRYLRTHRYEQIRRPRRLWPLFRKATHLHRMVIEDGPVWTLFITGPHIREWGFQCPKRWVHWREFTDESGNRTGRGCGE